MTAVFVFHVSSRCLLENLNKVLSLRRNKSMFKEPYTTDFSITNLALQPNELRRRQYIALVRLNYLIQILAIIKQ